MARPKKVSPELPSEDVSKIAEAITARAERKALESITVSPEVHEGRGGEGKGTDEHTNVIRDFLPGTKRVDGFHLPEHIYDQDIDEDRRLTLPQEYHYVFVSDQLVGDYRNRGYRFVMFDGGSQSGIAERGFKGTGLYERTLSGHVRYGDTILMYCHMRRYEEMCEEVNAQNKRWEQAAQGDYHNKGYNAGVRTFEEKDGQIVYN